MQNKLESFARELLRQEFVVHHKKGSTRRKAYLMREASRTESRPNAPGTTARIDHITTTTAANQPIWP